MTFTVTDALMSPQGLAVLTGAGLIKPNKGSNQAHVHTTVNVAVDGNGEAEITVDDLNEEYGLNADDYAICKTIDMFATELDGSGAGIAWFDGVTVGGGDNDSTEYVHITREAPATFTVNGAANTTVQLDFYTIMNNGVTEVQIEPSSFGGYFYVEAQTLFRREDTGKDMAAEIIIPKAKVQSAFTFTMAASGDPSTFDFVMDAFPGYTRFDNTKKQMCVIQIIGDDKKAGDDTGVHKHNDKLDKDYDVIAPDDSPSFLETFDVSRSSKVPSTAAPASFEKAEDYEFNQNKSTVRMNGNKMVVSVAGGVDSLRKWVSTDAGQAALGEKPWIAIDVNTGIDDITKVKYNGSALTAQDVADAAAWGLGAGHFILWIKADDVKTTPKAFTLSGEGFEDVAVTISIKETV